MSTTIGFSFCSNDVDIFRSLRKVAGSYGYELISGVEHSEIDVRSGILQAALALNWRSVFLLKAPIDAPASLAYGIDKEMLDFEYRA